MNINATCLIQIINFWITYALLHKILLAPFAQRITRKKILVAKLVDGLKDKQQLLVQLHNEKKTNLDSFRIHLKKNYALQPVLLEKIPEEVSVNVNEKEIDCLVAAQKDLIVKRIVSCIMK